MKYCMVCRRLLAPEEEMTMLCVWCARTRAAIKKATDQELANAIVALLSWKPNAMIEVTPLQAFKVVRRLQEHYHTGPELAGFLRILRHVDRTFQLNAVQLNAVGWRSYQLSVGCQSGSFTLLIEQSRDNDRYTDEDFAEKLRALVEPAWEEPGVTSVTVPIGAVNMGCYISW